MNIPIKYIAVVLGLILGFAAPPAKAEPLQTSPAPLWAVPTQMLPNIAQPQIKSLEPLKMADFKYSPMGTFPNSYPDQSQCTAGVASSKGNIPSWGNANQWDDNARASGKTVSSVPVVGAVAQTDGGYYGHVGVVVSIQGDSVTILEKNYDYNGSVRTHTVPTSSYVYIYL